MGALGNYDCSRITARQLEQYQKSLKLPNKKAVRLTVQQQKEIADALRNDYHFKPALIPQVIAVFYQDLGDEAFDFYKLDDFLIQLANELTEARRAADHERAIQLTNKRGVARQLQIIFGRQAGDPMWYWPTQQQRLMPLEKLFFKYDWLNIAGLMILIPLYIVGVVYLVYDMVFNPELYSIFDEILMIGVFILLGFGLYLGWLQTRALLILHKSQKRDGDE